jgi:hypothetical protein
MDERENFLRSARRQYPEWIPCNIGISGASFQQYGMEMVDIVSRHPAVFRLAHGDLLRQAQAGQVDLDRLRLSSGFHEAGELVDAWGCRWQYGVDGLEGIVVGHPLDDWAGLESYSPPDPLIQGDRGPVDWTVIAENARQRRQRGELTWGGPPHGFFFLRLTYLRGFENLMVDLASSAEQLPRLIETVMRHNRTLVGTWASLGLDMILLADDLGTQSASLVSPRTFNRWFVPEYRDLIAACKQGGSLVMFHSDGHVLELCDGFISAGVDIVNVQDLVNGIDELARTVKGRMALFLDIDRQSVVPFGTRAEIRELVEEEVRKLGDRSGGLQLSAGIYPPTTPDRVDALACAMEEFRTYWRD